MSLTYGYTAPSAVIDALLSMRRRDRDEVIRALDALAENPFVKPDRIQIDASGRPIQVKRFHRWEISFWSDHAAREVRVIDITRLLL